MIEITTTQQIGSFIKAARKRSGIRLVDAAMLSGVSHPVLSKIERGLEGGDVDAFTSLFSLLPQIGIRIYLGQADKAPVQVKSKRDIAIEIINKRKESRLTQNDIASLLGISTPTLSKLESPARKPEKQSDVRLKMLLKVLRGLGLKLFLTRPE